MWIFPTCVSTTFALAFASSVSVLPITILSPSIPFCLFGIVKFKITFLFVPTFLTDASVFGSPVSVVPISIVVGPFSPLGPVGPVGPWI